MAKERETKPMAAFFKFTEVGQMAAGVVSNVRQTENGSFFVIDKAVLRDSRKAKPVLYQSAAVGISTDIGLKTNGKEEISKTLLIEFQDTEPTTKGSKKKVFRVLELTGSEFEKLLTTCDISKKDQPYKGAETPAEQTDGFDGPQNDEDDDLPF
jgi:hypothetical protein